MKSVRILLIASLFVGFSGMQSMDKLETKSAQGSVLINTPLAQIRRLITSNLPSETAAHQKEQLNRSLDSSISIIKVLPYTVEESKNLFKEHVFCLNLTKELATKFNRSDLEVAHKLGFPATQNIWNIQAQLINLDEVYGPQYNNELVANLLNQGADLNFTYFEPSLKAIVSPLAFYITIDSPQISASLIAEGADVNQSINGTTALLLAILLNKVDFVTMLLDAGADPELGAINGSNALELARAQRNQAIITLVQNAIDKKHSRR